MKKEKAGQILGIIIGIALLVGGLGILLGKSQFNIIYLTLDLLGFISAAYNIYLVSKK